MEETALLTASDFLSYSNQAINEIFQRDINFIKSVIPESREREKTLTEYSIDGFNIFTSIADGWYWKELFHSYVLSLILNPETPKIGNRKYLQKFVHLLNHQNRNVPIYDFTDNVVVEREAKDKNSGESGSIDIFIHDDTHGIIIENKLNNAYNQPNQLARYLQIAKNNAIAVIAIVYIPLYQKEPAFEDYTGGYKGIIDEIRKKLVVLPAIKLAEDYLDTCVAISKDETARVYIEQYSTLIKNLGGKSMTNDIDKEFLRKVFSTKENIAATKNIADVWGKRTALLSEIFQAAIKKELNLEERENASGATVGKSIGNDVFLAFWFHETEIAIGFTPDHGKFSTSMQKKLKNVLDENEAFRKHFSDVETDEVQVYKDFYVDDFDASLEEMQNFLIEKYHLLEKTAKAALLSENVKGG
ncbi:hypothetical protein AGMMS49991_01290 [Spirochaetia bacterium]|nr:hypothetical protein AGMMS49991_01290 [Spirochaetia bacterium]